MLGDVPKGVGHRVVIGRAYLNGQVTVEQGRVQVVVGERPHGGQMGRPSAGEPEPVVEEGHTEPEDEGHLASRNRPAEDPVVVGGRRRSDIDGEPTGVEQALPLGDRTEQVLELRRRARNDVERHQRRVSSRRPEHSQLVRAFEGGRLFVDRRGCGGLGAVRGGGVRRGHREAAHRQRGPGSGDQTGLEEAASGNAGHVVISCLP